MSLQSLVKESGIVSIIEDYKYQLEMNDIRQRLNKEFLQNIDVEYKRNFTSYNFKIAQTNSKGCKYTNITYRYIRSIIFEPNTEMISAYYDYSVKDSPMAYGIACTNIFIDYRISYTHTIYKNTLIEPMLF